MAQKDISQVSEEIQRKVIKRLSKEISRRVSRILGTLSTLDEFLLNPQFRTWSVAVPGTSRNNDSESWEPTGDCSLGDPSPKAVFSACHPINLNNLEQDEVHHMVTGVQEEIPYCSPGTSSGKQKKARSTSQPQIRSEITPATIEADQILLAPQQLATKSNSSIFNNIINRIWKLPKSVKTTWPTFDGKSESFQLFEDFFQTSLKIHNQLTEEEKINYFHSLMRGDALQTFKNITSHNRENLGKIPNLFRKKYVKPQSRAAAKHKFHGLVFNPANQKKKDFLDELQKLAKRCIRSSRSGDQWAVHKCQKSFPFPVWRNQLTRRILRMAHMKKKVSHLEKKVGTK